MAPGDPYPGPRRQWLPAAGLGLCSGLCQVVLLRELMVIAGGNELSLGLGLAAWLGWTGLGAALSGRLARPRPGAAGLGLALAGSGGLAALVLTRLLPAWAGQAAGSVPSLGPALALVGTCLAPAGLGAGAGFPLLLAARPAADPPGVLARVYGLEALGAAAAGLAFGLFLVRWLNPVGVLALGGLLGAGAAWAAGPRPAWAGIWLAALALLLAFSAPVDARLQAARWHGRRLLAVRETPYAQLVVTGGAGQRDFFAGGRWLFSRPDAVNRAREGLLPLLARPRARRVLFLGGAADGAAAVAARALPGARVDAVELDPGLPALARELCGRGPPPANLRVIIGDGRRQLAASQGRYDLVVLALPPPQTVGLARFYGVEGLAAMARALAPGGAAVLILPGVEHLLGPMQARRLGGILAAAAPAFGRSLIISGPKLLLCLARQPGGLSIDPADWARRLKDSGWSGAMALDPVELADWLSPFRRGMLRAMVKRSGPARPGRDLMPRALLWDPQLWGAMLGGRSGLARDLAGLSPTALVWPPLVLALILALASMRPAGGRAALAAGVFVTGLSATGLSVLLLLAYQVLFGAVYLGLALLLAGFMAGMGGAPLWLGPRLVRLARPRLALALASVGLALACLATLGLVRGLHGLVDPQGWQPALAAMAAVAGGLTGSWFALAGRLRLAGRGQGPGGLVRAGGGLYGLDLAGGMTGALLPVPLLPVLGLGPCLWLLALLNLCPLVGLWAEIKKA